MLFSSFGANESDSADASSSLPVKGRDGVVVMIPQDCIPYEGPDGRVVAIPPGYSIVVGSNGRAVAVPANAIAIADANGAINLHPKTFGTGRLA
jgi:hypothetical protein